MKIPNMQLLVYREQLETSRFIFHAHNQKLMFHYMPQKLKFKLVLEQFSINVLVGDSLQASLTDHKNISLDVLRPGLKV